LAQFAVAVLLIELTPGPNLAWLAALAATRGRRAGFAAVIGIAAGLGVHVLLVALGGGALLATTPWLAGVLTWVGVGYLLWLALDAWREAETSAAKVAAAAGRGLIRDGFVTNVLNAKSLLFLLSVPTAFAGQQPMTGLRLATLGMLYVAIATAVHSMVVLGASRAAPWLAAAQRRRRVQRLMALILVMVAAWLAWGAVRG
jgi:threonine/homoserine/homoserine lactone efflux protein